MDARHFDALARAITENGSRRSLLALLATLPVVGGLMAWLNADGADAKERRRRRKTRHKKRHNKGKRRKKANKKCQPEAQSTTCAGRCGSVANNCQQAVDCGPCTCQPACQAGSAPDCVGVQCVCAANQDVACPTGETCCLAGCFDLETNPQHCGACGFDCAQGLTCQGGQCGVPCGGDFCVASSEVCFNGACHTCDVACESGPCSGTALQNKMSLGGTVYVCPGRYTGNFVLNPNATIVGAGQGDNEALNTILDGQENGRVVTAAGNTYALHQLRITGGKDQNGAGLECSLGNVSMIDCTITRNNLTDPEFAVTGGGISVHNAVLGLTRCTISHNRAPGDAFQTGVGGGIYKTGKANSVTLTSTLVTENAAGSGGGIYGDFGTFELYDTFIWNNTGGNCAGGTNVHGSGGCGVTPPG